MKNPTLDQDQVFIKDVSIFDYTKYMGQYALEIKYTNGNTQMFTTKSTNPNQFGHPDFDSKEELLTFYESIKPK